MRFDGVLKPLDDPERFAGAFVDFGTVCWPNDLDLAPELLYEALSRRQLPSRG